MKETYYTLENGNLKKVGNVIKTSRGWVSNPTAEDCATIGAYPRSEESFAPPTVDEGYRAVPSGYDLENGKWVKLWKVEPIIYTEADYDNAMEDYLREVRSARGYTMREPSPHYDNSRVARWAQDAKDWKEFLEDVMLYALPVLNEYQLTGKAPMTLAEFKANLPKITWNY